MTFFREALRRFDPLSIVPHPLPASPAVVERGEEFRRLFWDGETSPPDDLAALAARIVPALEAGEDLTWRDWSLSPWCLWRTDPAIAERPEAFKRFAAYIEQDASGRTIRTLARVYVVQFDRAAPRVSEVSKLVDESLRRTSGRHARSQRTFGLFPLSDGPRHYAERCVSRDMSFEDVMDELAFDEQERRGGFARLIFDEGLAILAARHQDEKSASSVRAIVIWRRAGQDDDETVFKDAEPAFADALLAPFVDEAPSPEAKKALLFPLLRRMGDPRLNPEIWARASEGGRRAATRLTTELSLQQYFEIVDDAAFQDHWEHRRAFWKAYVDQGHIDEAWVAFGPRGGERARDELGEEARFAHLLRGDRRQIEPGHAVLMVRIGSAMVADWSHRGACHVWGPADERPPILYKSFYMAEDMMHEERAQSERVFYHTNSEGYGWQDKVADRIAELTGVRPSKENYQVVHVENDVPRGEGEDAQATS